MNQRGALIAAAGLLGPVLLLILFVVIAGGGGTADASCAAPGAGGATGNSTPGDQDQTKNVRIIIGVAKALHIGSDGQIVAVATALDESQLRNLANTNVPESTKIVTNKAYWGHDHMSVGQFQQQVNFWHTPEQPYSGGTKTVAVQNLLDPTFSAAAFFGGPKSPVSNGGLLDVKGWQDMEPTVAIQHVQVSATPDIYTRFVAQARTIVAQNSDAPAATQLPPPAGSGHTAKPKSEPDDVGGCAAGGTAATGNAAGVIAAGKKYLGYSYVLGGGDFTGPSQLPRGSGPRTKGSGAGFDCASFTANAYYTGAHIKLPLTATAQFYSIQDKKVGGASMKPAQMQPGDLIYFGTLQGATSTSLGHVVMYIGGGKIMEAATFGEPIHIIPYYDFDGSEHQAVVARPLEKGKTQS